MTCTLRFLTAGEGEIGNTVKVHSHQVQCCTELPPVQNATQGELLPLLLLSFTVICRSYIFK